MIVLGISGGHDANWCIVEDGVLLGAYEKERFTRERYASGEVVSLIPETLAKLNLTVDDIDLVATTVPVHKNAESGLRLLAGRIYETINDWQHQTVELLGRILPCVCLPHHVAHAAYARYASGFPETAAITWDAGGDLFTVDAHTSTTVSHWKGNRLEWIERVPNSDIGSLWFAYSKVVFSDPNVGGKLMGLASFGTPAMLEQMRDRFMVTQNGTFDGALTVKNCWPDFERPPFGQPGLTWRDRHAKDLAYAVQAITTECGLSLARKARELTGVDRLVLSGGCALNAYTNTAVKRMAGYRDVFVPPAVADGGLAVGCALFALHHVLDVPYRGPRPDFNWATVGMGYTRAEAADSLRAHGLPVAEVDRDEAIDRAAGAIAEERVVGWFEGRSEHGPRALGSRSLLSAVHSDEYRRRLNAEIKYREEFRPVAPVVPERRASEYFSLDAPSPYMMYITEVTDRCARECPAAVHVDGTARVQTVDDESGLGRIATAVERRGLPPVIVNTSFNVNSPIVNSPDDAVETFLKSPIDMLYMEGHLVERHDIARR